MIPMRQSIIILSVLTALIIACAPAPVDRDYASYCSNGISEVHECGDYVRAVKDNLGGGTRWYDASGNYQDCPVVSPAAMSIGCKSLFENDKDCVKVYDCPSKYIEDPVETVCIERPEICTMDYTPVCAKLSDGTTGTYGNACGACGDAMVVSHTPGECPEEVIVEEPEEEGKLVDKAPPNDFLVPQITEPTNYQEVVCGVPRPDDCTRIRDPVCAKLQNLNTRTYDNKCTACHDPDVYSYSQGNCPKIACSLSITGGDCTGDTYNPVCADFGLNQKQTFPTACEACTATGVKFYEMGACQQTFNIEEGTEVIVDGEIFPCTAEERAATSCEPIYDLVCAVKLDGNQLTFGNACSACRNNEVTGYYKGFCKWHDQSPYIAAYGR
ncbi:hypothetical protein GOV07_05770 [Candidatus Woesearchaeota archaeon]|nr:hypothetical protein [Candidatus Woesearchaeota archaeon]